MNTNEQQASCADLCFAWNVATNPAKLRTDDEHQECRATAARLMSEIQRRFRYGFDYVESDHTGRLIAR